MSIRRACDRCYRCKEKCHYEDDVGSCAPCQKSGSTCTTLRKQPRQGRRPRVKRLGPNSSVQVWEVESSSTDAKTTRSPSQSPAQTPSPLSHESMKHVGFSPSQIPSLSLCPWAPGSPEELFESSPVLITQFYYYYDLFMLGPTFAPSFRAAIQQSYMGSPNLLQDMFIAIHKTMKRTRQEHSEPAHPVVSGEVTSLQKLRTARIERVKDALAIISLGQTLAAFDFLSNCLGSPLILRYTLSSIQPWYEDLSRNPSFDPVTITPIFWDTVSCLVRREIPVVQFRPRGTHIVDRVAGLCTSLLPILYDLCIAGQTLKDRRNPWFKADQSQVRRIERRLLSWTPEAPFDFSSTFSRQEILGMKAHALMYRSAGLLVAHRLLNPIGTSDEVACSYANSILEEFAKHQGSAGPDARLHHVAFPILMASLEISDIPLSVWESIPSLAVAPVCFAKMQAFVEHVWMERLCGSTSLIFDLVESGPDFVVLP